MTTSSLQYTLPVMVRRFALFVVVAVGGVWLYACQTGPQHPVPAPPVESAAFTAFVDEFLDQFASHHPSIAAGNGLHQADGRLEDFSATAIQSEIAMWRGMQQRLTAIVPDGLIP